MSCTVALCITRIVNVEYAFGHLGHKTFGVQAKLKLATCSKLPKKWMTWKLQPFRRQGARVWQISTTIAWSKLDARDLTELDAR